MIAFRKLDGSNLRFEWHKSHSHRSHFGWIKYGTRRRLFNKSDPDFGCAIELFLNTHAESLAKIFTDNKDYRKRDKYTAFCEFLGPNSFAGLHKPEDPKELFLFDIWQDKFGIIGPRQFLQDFGHLKIAPKVYEGKLTGQFAEDVRNGKFPVDEGVVCKGGAGGGWNVGIWMVKIKTYAYLEKLKKVFANNWQDFWE